MNLRTLQTGNLLIEAAEESLRVSLQGCPGCETDVSFEDLPAILDFLNTQRKLQMNRRRGFRINIKELNQEDGNSLEVFVTTDEGRIQLQPIDFSLGGILAESDTPIGNEGDVVAVAIAYMGTRITLPASIVRVLDESKQVAFHFQNVTAADGRLDPPAALTTIFAALEACWLDSSLDLHWN